MPAYYEFEFNLIIFLSFEISYIANLFQKYVPQLRIPSRIDLRLLEFVHLSVKMIVFFIINFKFDQIASPNFADFLTEKAV